MAFIGHEGAAEVWRQLGASDANLAEFCDVALATEPAFILDFIDQAEAMKRLGSQRQPAAGGGSGNGQSGLDAYDDGDLDCEDIGAEVYVGSDDPNGLDADGDGWGCEGW